VEFSSISSKALCKEVTSYTLDPLIAFGNQVFLFPYLIAIGIPLALSSLVFIVTGSDHRESIIVFIADGIDYYLLAHCYRQ